MLVERGTLLNYLGRKLKGLGGVFLGFGLLLLANFLDLDVYAWFDSGIVFEVEVVLVVAGGVLLLLGWCLTKITRRSGRSAHNPIVDQE
jgi:hypothetical protein